MKEFKDGWCNCQDRKSVTTVAGFRFFSSILSLYLLPKGYNIVA
ncbi:hypothetical protein PPO43_13845 [Saprospira sp. CCB-QB6]|nr:hypothetical protein [Saprospira sp. CCB-QB6]WCL81052.1 hypothetical protein PPO43_13845 [Saprospira sp. CCB-QB6]